MLAVAVLACSVLSRVVQAADGRNSQSAADARCVRGPEPARGRSSASPANRAAGDGGVLLVVPGVADAARALLVARNVAHVSPRACLVFTHVRCGDDTELDVQLDVDGSAPVAAACEVVRAPNGNNGGYVAHLKRVLPSFVEMGRFEWVFVLLDDVQLSRENFDLARMLRIAVHNNLTTVSPAVRFPHDEVMSAPATPHPRGVVGRVTKRAEVFALALTTPAFRCWYELIDTALNSIGWGYDHWLYHFCKSWGSLHYKAGIVDVMEVVHGGQASGMDSSNTSAAAFMRTYGSREAKSAKEAMRNDFKRRGMPPLHPVDRLTHGWLYDPDAVGQS